MTRKVWLEYDEVRLYVTTYKSGGEGKGNAYTDTETDIQIDQIGKTDRYE